MKNRSAIYTLFAANTISGFAQGISMIAIPWYFVNTLNMPDFLGQLFMLIMIGSLFWGVYAGSLVDRFDRKKLYMATSAIGCTMLLLVAGYGFLVGPLTGVLVGLIYATTFFIYNIHYPNLYAFIQEISDPKDYGKVTSYIEIQGQTTTAIAGTFAAVLLEGTKDGMMTLAGFEFPVGFSIRAWELHEIFLLDGFTYVISTLLIYSIRYTSIAHRSKEDTPILERLRSGFDFLMKNPMLMLFGIVGGNIFVTVLVTNFYLTPIYVENHLKESADVYASYELYWALGSLLAGIAIQRIFNRTTTPMTVIILTVLSGSIWIFYAFNTTVALYYLGAFLLGLSNSGSRIMRVTYLFRRTPNQVIGRTSSIFASANVLFRIFFTGIFLFPFFYRSNNIVWAYVISGVFLLISAVVLMLYYQRIIAKPIIDQQQPTDA